MGQQHDDKDEDGQYDKGDTSDNHSGIRFFLTPLTRRDGFYCVSGTSLWRVGQDVLAKDCVTEKNVFLQFEF